MSATMFLRAVRAAAFAVVSVVLGLGAHVFAGGAVSARTLLVAMAGSFLLAFAVAGRERSRGVIFLALAASQAALHVLFSVAHTVEPLAAAHSGHVHSGLVPGLGMLVTHAWAAGMTALWLSRGEALVWALLRRLESRLRLIVVAAVDPAYVSFVLPLVESAPTPRSAMLGHQVGRRGPPPAAGTVTA
ncbi:hypothetical protein Aph01nite_22650 [Acrocarpospora phusangensis]|uniref:Uncharacterized protein n=1 Tax=Acrocarpospora phusangensis TaxID=1070424 RepID=A0A919QAU8_9ACTN|nr:MFS transporter [Acrocarpospora phusangensis]GIH23955.1 hypothetical protein Aph01nite_22650 [Acrocarpospora phusangensis]